jgi:uncharacterized protein
MIETSPQCLTREERRALLALARRAIAARLGREALRWDGFVPTAGMERLAGVFVTIRDRGDLRGCIGVLEPSDPLYREVASAAVSAAFGDPRFAPVSAGLLPRLALEISVLSPFEPVVSIDEIAVGRHGLIARESHRAGLLLPQVAPEYGWTREEYLDHLCVKAGLPRGRWRGGTVRLEKFTAEVFSEVSEI